MAEDDQKTEEEIKVEPIVIEHPNLVTALAHTQLEYKPVVHNQNVDFLTKEGRQVKYSYADLASIRAATDPCLNKHGLVVTDKTELREDREFLVSTLYHAGSDETHETSLDITTSSSEMKDIAANMTYARRYNYCNLTGRIAEEDNDARDVQQRQGKQASQSEGTKEKQEDKKPTTPPMKIKYYQILSDNKIFANDDLKHTWQGLAISGKPSSQQWTISETKKAIDLIQWRLVVGVESDALLEYVTTKAKSTKGLQKQFLAVMDVSKLTAIKDVSHWTIAMAGAKLSIDHKLEVALDMGKACMRANATEGLFDKIKEVIGVDKMSQMSSEQVKVWETSFRSAVNQFQTEHTDIDLDVEQLIKGEEAKV